MTTPVYKSAVVLKELGELGMLPDGGTINAGGVSGPYFTLNGKPFILADGTASDGSGPVIVVGQSAPVQGFEFIQSTPSLAWSIVHNKGSQRIQITVWDETNELLYSDSTTIVDLNTIEINFNTPVAGRAILMIF